MKVLNAHNCFTAYKPIGIMGKVLNFFARCQTKNISELWENGVRGFDIRFRVEDDKVIASHGLVDYNVDVFNALEEVNSLNTDNDKVYIRIINEDTFKKSSPSNFMHIVSLIKEAYPNFIYNIISSKKAWTVVESFKMEEFECIGSALVPFTTPKIYSKIYNALFWRIYDKVRNGMFYLDFI